MLEHPLSTTLILLSSGYVLIGVALLVRAVALLNKYR